MFKLFEEKYYIKKVALKIQKHRKSVMSITSFEVFFLYFILKAIVLGYFFFHINVETL